MTTNHTPTPANFAHACDIILARDAQIKELIAALKRAELALADIINAAGNGEEYSAAELEENFLDDLEAIRDARAKAGAL